MDLLFARLVFFHLIDSASVCVCVSRVCLGVCVSLLPHGPVLSPTIWYFSALKKIVSEEDILWLCFPIEEKWNNTLSGLVVVVLRGFPSW